MKNPGSMRLVLLLLVGTMTVGFVRTAHARDAVFYRNLSLGMSGEDVKELQKVLNQDPSTPISDSGAGSPGQESDYFGPKTLDAVIRYQEANRAQILEPSGLDSGTGFVGPATLTVLNGSENEDQAADSSSVTAPDSAEEPAPVPVAQSPIVVNLPRVNTQSQPSAVSNGSPNGRNLDRFLSSFETMATKKNIPADKIAKLKSQIRLDAASTTDFRKQFLDTVKSNQIKRTRSLNDAGTFGNFLSDTSELILGLLHPKQALALGLDGDPFGGAVIYPYPCVCSANWLVLIEPLAPDYVFMLSYEPFSQAYLNYNMPYGEWLLGMYEPDEGYCEIYIPPYECYEVPTEGLITPTVGSSLY